MPTAHPHLRPVAPWLRVLAVVCAGLVFTLSSAAWSPALHAWLHGHIETHGHDHVHAHAACSHAHVPETNTCEDADPNAAHECAVTLFAHGVTTAAAFLFPLEQSLGKPLAAPLAPECMALATAEHLRPQPHAPPVG